MGIHDGHREKMRRRFLSGGLEQFADHEALELLLYYMTKPEYQIHVREAVYLDSMLDLF